MQKTFKSLAAAAAITISSAAMAQLKVPAPSPSQTIKQAFALSEISIEYSRPSMKGRTIYGELVPYGKIWRTGANAATKITFAEDVKVEGTAIPTGTYAIYTTPGKDSWTIHFYKDLTLGGNVSEYKKENELAVITVKPKKLNDKVETLTFDIADITSNTAMVQLNWEMTRIEFKVEADIDSKIMKNIEANVIKDNRPYFQAASYYYDNNKDLIKAAEWADKAFEANPKGYWILMLKAKIQAKQGQNDAAIATALQVKTLATEAKNDDYVKMADELIASAKKK